MGGAITGTKEIHRPAHTETNFFNANKTSSIKNFFRGAELRLGFFSAEKRPKRNAVGTKNNFAIERKAKSRKKFFSWSGCETGIFFWQKKIPKRTAVERKRIF